MSNQREDQPMVEKGTMQNQSRKSWEGVLDDRQNKHVEFCLSYVVTFNHGAPGHLDYTTIARLAQLVGSQAAMISDLLSKVAICPECGDIEAQGDTTREQLAAYAHEAWSGWMKYLFSKCEDAGEEGCVLIPASSAQRWERQMNTLYPDLPEDEKASDRDEADKMLAIVRGT